MCKTKTRMEKKLKFVKEYENNCDYYHELYECYPNSTYDAPCVQVWRSEASAYECGYEDELYIGSDRSSWNYDWLWVEEGFDGFYEDRIDIIKLYNYIEFKYGDIFK